MIKPHQTKIAIVGCGGSGKTFLGLHLHKLLDLPLYHLDQYYWKPDWQRTDYEEFTKIHHDLCARHAWIIEGSSYKLFHHRAQQADVIIFLDMPRYLCLSRVIKRTATNLGSAIPGSPQECKQQLFTYKFLEFLIWIWNYNNKNRQTVIDILTQSGKQVHIIRSKQEMDRFLEAVRISKITDTNNS